MIFLTGGTGFLGRNLLPTLVAAGHTVRVLTRDVSRHPWLNTLNSIEPIIGDVADATLMKRAVNGCDTVIHAAAKFRFWGKRNDFHHTNVVGTRHVLDAARAANVSRFVHISSVVVVGNPANTTSAIDETHATNPQDVYQETKLAAEQLALAYHHEFQLPVTVLRPGAYYGPHGHYAFNKMFFEDPLTGWRLGVNGGRHYTFPTFIEDAVQAIMLALQHGKSGEIYNICSQSLTHRDVDKIFSATAGIPAGRLYIPQRIITPLARVLNVAGALFGFEPKYPMTLRSYIFNDWHVSIEKARQTLGFVPTPFEDGVGATLAWYAKRGLWQPKESA